MSTNENESKIRITSKNIKRLKEIGGNLVAPLIVWDCVKGAQPLNK